MGLVWSQNQVKYLGQQLRGDAAEGAQQRPPGVDDLDLPVALEGLRVSRQAGGVPPARATRSVTQAQRRRCSIR